MSRINPIKANQAGPELKRSSQNNTRQKLGEAPNFLRILANSPMALRAYIFAETALERGQLTPRQRAQIALAVAEINGSGYGLSAHYDAGKRLGLTHVDMQLARQATATDPQTATMLRFAQGVVLQRGEVSDEDFLALRRAGFTAPLIIETVASIVLNIFTNYLNSVAKTEVDFPPLQPGTEIPGVDLRSGEESVCRTADKPAKTSGK